MKKLLLFLLILIGIAVAALYFTGNFHVLQAVQKTYLIGQKGPSIDDFNHFTHHRVAAAPGKPLPLHSNKSALPDADVQWLDSMETATFLVMHRDSVLAEHYFGDYDQTFTPNTFSSAKSLVSMSIGVLLRQDLISLEEPAAKYIPELAEKGYDDITIRHLLQMSSGIGFDEDYKNPFGYQAKVYYGDNLRENTLAFEPVNKPGEEWFYAGGNTVLLALIVESVSGKRLSHFFSENIWQKIGAESDAWWTVDAKDGIERSSCCFYAITRDLARLGMLYKNGGEWNGQELVPEWFVQESITPVMIPDSNGEPVMHYGYQWWLGDFEGKPFFQAQGMLGQYIIVVPDLDLVIVRTGHNRSADRKNGLPADTYKYIEIAKSLLP